MNRRHFITSISIAGFANLFLPRLADRYLWKTPRTEVGLNAWEVDGKLVHVPIPHGLDAALERQQKLWQEARKMLIREFDQTFGSGVYAASVFVAISEAMKAFSSSGVQAAFC